MSKWLNALKYVGVKIVADAIQAKVGLDFVAAKKVVEDLWYYGHLPINELPSLLEGEAHDKSALMSVIEKGVASYQYMAGLKVDGQLSPQFERVLTLPRCGCPDLERDEAGSLIQHSLEEAKWPKKNLKYYVERYVRSLPKEKQDAIIARAWQSIQDVCGLTFTRTSSLSDADMVISTGAGRAYQFDGPSGTLAWAYLGYTGGQYSLMRFDDAENWLEHGSAGILMENVACHEFCHLCNISHHNAPNSLMNPYYSANIAKPQQADIKLLQQLYGPSVNIPQPPPPPIDGKQTLTLELTGGKIDSVKIISLV